MIELHRINTFYGLGHILHDLSLRVGESEVVALLGRNGAGKTTTMRSIAGLTPPRSGEIRYKGRNIAGLEAHRVSKLGIALVPETRDIFSYLTARENLAIARRAESRWQMDNVLERFPRLKERLNNKPMGFYAPAQLVQDARRHGVEVLPPDVNASEWDCTLEGGMLRLGLRMVRGLSEAGGRSVALGRPYASINNLELNKKDLRCLAAAGALASIAGHRREAHWAAAGAGRRAPLDAPAAEPAPRLAPPGEGAEIVADYASLGLTLGRHPLELLRDRLEKMNLSDARRIQALPHGRAVRVAGLVTCRQRPDTASGVVFVTLEDETGCMNIVVWRTVFERQRAEALGARLLGVEGAIERDGEVVHLVARRLHDYTHLLGPLMTSSRDFH